MLLVQELVLEKLAFQLKADLLVQVWGLELVLIPAGPRLAQEYQLAVLAYLDQFAAEQAVLDLFCLDRLVPFLKSPPPLNLTRLQSFLY